MKNRQNATMYYRQLRRHLPMTSFKTLCLCVSLLSAAMLSCEDTLQTTDQPCPTYDPTNSCANTCVGLIPISDLGTSTYLGLQGGLYPDGSNLRPAAHNTAGLAIANQIEPLDGSGAVDYVSGRIVLLSVGMSNAMQEFTYFQLAADTLSIRNPALTIINGAQGGKDIDKILDTNDVFWDVVQDSLDARGVTAVQVQVLWFKEAESHPIVSPTFPAYPDDLKARFEEAMNLLRERFPNAKLCYLASRIYGNYGTNALNPEPFAYYQGWAVKRLIEDQIGGDLGLVYDGTNPNSPWLSWGVYQWADGTNPRSDGLIWVCPDDYDRDGNHPSIIGRQKVAGLLMDFFTTDETTTPWFLQ